VNDQLKHYANKLAYEIDSWDLQVALNAGEAITLIDTRSPEAFAREHIPGALNIPHRMMAADTTRHIDRDVVVVTYCDGIGCNGSTKGALEMLKLGFHVKELTGGLDWWKRDGHTTHVSSAGSETAVSCGCN
jgi:rhodanese-related sulfurtransferase